MAAGASNVCIGAPAAAASRPAYTVRGSAPRSRKIAGFGGRTSIKCCGNTMGENEEEDDGVHGGRMKPLASFCVNTAENGRCRLKSLGKKPLATMVSVPVNGRLTQIDAEACKENLAPCQGIRGSKRKSPPIQEHAREIKSPRSQGVTCIEQPRASSGACRSLADRNGSMDMLLMALDTCSTKDNVAHRHDEGRGKISGNSPEEKNTDEASERFNSEPRRSLEAIKKWKQLRSSVFNQNKRKAEDDGYTELEQVKYLKPANDEVLDSANLDHFEAIPMDVENVYELPVAALKNANQNLSVCLTSTQDMQELPLLDSAGGSTDQVLVTDEHNDVGGNDVSLILCMGTNTSTKVEKSRSNKRLPSGDTTSATDLFLGPYSASIATCQENSRDMAADALPALESQSGQSRPTASEDTLSNGSVSERHNKLPAGTKRVTLVSLDTSKTARTENCEEQELEVIGEFKPGIMSRVRDGKKVRAILGAVVGSTILQDPEDCQVVKTEHCVPNISRTVGCPENKEGAGKGRLNPEEELFSAEEALLMTPMFSNAAANVAARWLELLNLDLKGRLAALKRSRRRVRGVIVSGQFGNNSAPSMKRKHDLQNDKWMSLFMNMDASLAAEGSKLENCLKKVQEMQKYCMHVPHKSHADSQQQGRVCHIAQEQQVPTTTSSWPPKVPINKSHALAASAASICSTANFALNLDVSS